MVGSFIAPLTERGRALVDAIGTLDEQLLGPIEGHDAVIQERFVAMQGAVAFRLNRIEAFKEALAVR